MNEDMPQLLTPAQQTDPISSRESLINLWGVENHGCRQTIRRIKDDQQSSQIRNSVASTVGMHGLAHATYIPSQLAFNSVATPSVRSGHSFMSRGNGPGRVQQNKLTDGSQATLRILHRHWLVFRKLQKQS